MWWREVLALGERLAVSMPFSGILIDPAADVAAGVELDDSAGPIVIGARVKVCAGAVIRGPVFIDDDAVIGNGALIRGPVSLGSGVLVGHAAEIKHALIGERVSIGPMCFIADSKVDADAYLGAMVRTSNQRLDRRPVAVRHEGRAVETGAGKLGCWIGRGASLGIQVIVLPGRVIAPGTLIEPRVTIAANLPAGHYRLRQDLEAVA